MNVNKVSKVLATAALSASLFMSAGTVDADPLKPYHHSEWMAEQNILKGDLQGNFHLDRHITMAEAVIFLARTKGAEVPELENPKHWSTPYMQWAHGEGAISEKESMHPYKQLKAEEAASLAGELGYEVSFEQTGKITRGMFLQGLGEAATKHITIGHTNDVHGNIEEDSYNKKFGYAKMATLIDQWRAENENFLLLDAGDTFQGTIFVNQFQGESVLPILNHLNYDVMAAGNHEFDFGYEQLLKLRDQLDYPMISANVFKPDGTELLVPVHYQEVAGEKYAFIGFVAEETPVLTHPDNVEGLTFKSPVAVAQEMVPKLQEQADHVVVVSHVGLSVDREIAEKVDGIDLIVGGHSHTPVDTPERVNDTYIVQDWEYGKSLGRADLYYYNDELVGFTGGLKKYDASVKADPEIEAMVEKITEQVDKKMQEVITTTDELLVGERSAIRSQETNLGNLIADVMLEKTQSIEGHEADIALTNSGGIRAEIKPGEVTKLDLYNVLPFGNTLATMDVTGSEIKTALENGVSKISEVAGRFPQIAGMSFTYDVTKPAGERVGEVMVGGEPLDESKTYKLATNSFLAAGGDGYAMFKDNESFNTGYTTYDIVEQHLKELDSINTEVEERIVETSQQ